MWKKKKERNGRWRDKEELFMNEFMQLANAIAVKGLIFKVIVTT